MSYKYFIVNNIVFDNEYLTIKEDYLLLMLYKYRDTKTNIASPKEDYLLSMLDCSKSSLNNYLGNLADRDLIIRKNRRGKSNEYKLLNTKEGGFTILPSMLVGCKGNDLYNDMVYAHLCRLTGKNNSTQVSYARLRKRVKCRKKTLIKSLRYLEDSTLIKLQQQSGLSRFTIFKGDIS